MKDVFRNYHKHKVLTNIGIIGISFILAISINMLLVWNQSGQLLKASVLDATNTVSTSDIEIVKNASWIAFIANQDMSSVTELSFSIAYNADAIELWDLESKLSWVEITEIENESGYKNLIFTFQSETNISGSNIFLNIPVTINTTETNYINIINANFKDSSWETYLLTTSWIIF